MTDLIPVAESSLGDADRQKLEEAYQAFLRKWPTRTAVSPQVSLDSRGNMVVLFVFSTGGLAGRVWWYPDGTMEVE